MHIIINSSECLMEKARPYEQRIPGQRSPSEDLTFGLGPAGWTGFGQRKSRGVFLEHGKWYKDPKAEKSGAFEKLEKGQCAYSVVSQEVGGKRLICQVKLDVSCLKDFEFYFKCNRNHGRF